MALPLLDGDSTITLLSPLVSRPYVDITLQVLSAYGIDIKETESGFYIKGNARYKGCMSVQGDWSNEGFFLVLGAIAGQVAVKGLDMNSVQGDKIIIELLKKAGVKVEVDGDKITTFKSKINAFSFNAENCPDVVPIASVLAGCADGVSVIDGVERLKIKESDRIESVINMLSCFGIKAISDGKSLTVYGGKAVAGVVDSFNDHRIAMSSAVLASVAQGESKITCAQAVNKSYPTFYKDYCKVGGKAYEL
jgi:3-phosphoshikimate 1-carboxyvinyltransferase